MKSVNCIEIVTGNDRHVMFRNLKSIAQITTDGFSTHSVIETSAGFIPVPVGDDESTDVNPWYSAYIKEGVNNKDLYGAIRFFGTPSITVKLLDELASVTGQIARVIHDPLFHGISPLAAIFINGVELYGLMYASTLYFKEDANIMVTDKNGVSTGTWFNTPTENLKLPASGLYFVKPSTAEWLSVDDALKLHQLMMNMQSTDEVPDNKATENQDIVRIANRFINNLNEYFELNKIRGADNAIPLLPDNHKFTDANFADMLSDIFNELVISTHPRERRRLDEIIDEIQDGGLIYEGSMVRKHDSRRSRSTTSSWGRNRD